MKKLSYEKDFKAVIRRLDVASVTVGLFVALVIVGYPLTSVLTTLLGLSNRLVSIGVRGITLAIAIVLFVVIGVRERRLYIGFYWVPLIVFWSWYLLRLAYDVAFIPENLRLTAGEYFTWAVATATPIWSGRSDSRFGAARPRASCYS
jgi:hypothetical protein